MCHCYLFTFPLTFLSIYIDACTSYYIDTPWKNLDKRDTDAQSGLAEDCTKEKGNIAVYQFHRKWFGIRNKKMIVV